MIRNLMILLLAAPAGAATVHVDDSATGANDGSTWADAYVSLQDALAAAGGGDEVWVAAGVYRPDQGAGVTAGDRTARFDLPGSVAVYGGFNGTESSLAQRAGLFTQTVLSGDLAQDDLTVGNAENSFHVVFAGGSTSSTILDGFLVTAGHANGAGTDEMDGAGMFVQGNVTVRNVTFRGSTAAGAGGGLFTDFHDDPVIEDCDFIDNTAAEGGGMNADAHCDPILTRCRFSGNTATSNGGGLHADVHCDPFLTDCVFVGNTAASDGGGMAAHHHSDPKLVGCDFIDNEATEGGGFHHFDHSDPRLVNCRFLGNTAALGGGVYSWGIIDNVVHLQNCEFSGNHATQNGGGLYTQQVIPSNVTRVVNCSFSANSAAGSGGGVFVADSDARQVANCVLWGNTDAGGTDESAQIHGGAPSVDHCIVTGFTGALGGAGNSAADPLLVDADGPDDVLGNDDDDLRLGPGSPGRDAGDNGAVLADALDLDDDGDVTEPTPLDAAGNARFVDDVLADAGAGIPPLVDVGALEAVDAAQVCQTNLGFQGPGSMVLSICGQDLSTPAQSATFAITNGPSNGSALLVLGVGNNPTPFFGGLLVPIPIALVVTLPLDASGGFSFPFSSGPGAPVTVFAQAAADDAGTVVISNALEVFVTG